jgi:hypothetical protein
MENKVRIHYKDEYADAVSGNNNNKITIFPSALSSILISVCGILSATEPYLGFFPKNFRRTISSQDFCSKLEFR